MIIVYYLSDEGPKMQAFTDNQLSAALTKSTELRKDGFRHVSISSEPGDMIGGFGVDAVQDGVLPDGHKYEWSKAHRAGTKAVKG